MGTTLTTEFWQTLDALRSRSRLILAALEEDDIDKVERLAQESERLIAELRPDIEERVAAAERSEEDRELAMFLGELKSMNDRILDEVAVRSRETMEELGTMRSRRLQLVKYKPETDPTPAMVNRET